MKVIQSHPENPIAYIVYDLLEDSKIDKNTDISALFSNFSKEGRKTELKENKEYTKRSRTIYDYRFRNLQMRNFRKFPHDEKRNYPYGIDFLMEDGPASLILVGSNGTGKTSLFSAMEYTMTRFLSSANLRNIPEKEYPHYLAYSNQRFENVQVVLDTEKETIYSDTLNPELANYDFLKCFFCSERDLVEMGRQESLLEYITGEVGYEEYLEVIGILKEIYAKCTNDLKVSKNMLTDLLLKKEELEKVELEEEVFEIVSKEKFYLQLLNYSLAMTKDDRVIEYKEAYLKALFTMNADRLEFNLPQIKELGNEMEAAEKLNLIKQWVEEYEKVAGYFMLNFEESARKIPAQSYLKVWLEREIKKIQALSSSNKDNFIDIYNDRLGRYQTYNFKRIEEIKKKSVADLVEFINNPDSPDILQSWEEDQLKQTNLETKIKELKVEIAEKEQKVEKMPEIELIEPLLKIFIDDLQKEYATQLRFLDLLYRDFVEKILNHFSTNKEKYTLSLTDKKLDILVEYEDIDHQVVQKTPREYLNSFRFKLFNMSVKVAMAMAAMRINKIAHPIVFDDVFYSSDFENRGRVEEFIRRLFEAYKDNVKPHVDNKNLQVVFLTHDDIIMDAIREGIQSLEYTVPVQYGRLFDYREMNRPKDLESYIYAKTQPPLNPATKSEKNRYIRLYINLQ